MRPTGSPKRLNTTGTARCMTSEANRNEYIIANIKKKLRSKGFGPTWPLEDYSTITSDYIRYPKARLGAATATFGEHPE